jgi:hypothetical protein
MATLIKVRGYGPRGQVRVCGDDLSVPQLDDGLRHALRNALLTSNSTADDVEIGRLAEGINCSLLKRKLVRRLCSRERLVSARDDILRLILDAYDAGNRDEALWRTFIAAHFGRMSASKDVVGQVESSHRFLCAFGSEPHWTWTKVSDDPQLLCDWLLTSPDKLQQLSFGNHRKFESKKPYLFWEVMDSFIKLVATWCGSPAALFETNASLTPQLRHAEIYERLRIRRFRRTGRFDFLALVGEMGLVDIEPGTCYLIGSTGPLEGAKQLWGQNKTGRELDRLAVELAVTLRLSPLVIEDALCNWQKR